eukprot:3142262-Prymnesium_polylepis.1
MLQRWSRSKLRALELQYGSVDDKVGLARRIMGELEEEALDAAAGDRAVVREIVSEAARGTA